jgi:hypothetical protein
MRLQERIRELEQRLAEKQYSAVADVPAAADQKAAVAPPAGGPEISEKRSNVVPLKPGDGSLVVDRPLEERYPLRHLDPVS